MHKESKVQIHAFCDASERANGIVIYVRVMDANGEIRCSLLSAKSRVAPIKTISIPRLELLAAVMLSEQLEAIINTCELKANSVTLWSDSMIVLYWIKKQSQDLKAFVSNRVKIIQEKTKKFQWKHIRSADNPADLVSRGLDISDFLKNQLWLHGPPWITQGEEHWPKTKLIVSPQEKNEILKECKAMKSEGKILNIYVDENKVLLFDKFQGWEKIINITAYIFRFIHNAKKNKKKNNANERISGRYLKLSERNNAKKFWIRYQQKNAFHKEIKAIQEEENMPNKSKISALRPILDKESLLRVGGRIDKANIRYDKRHQFIIPSKSRLSFLLLKHAHETTLHGGVQIMTQYLRKLYWIPKLRQEAKCYINHALNASDRLKILQSK